MKIALLPGDGIGPEIVAEAVKVLKGLDERFEFEEAPFGGAGYEASGRPLPEATLTALRGRAQGLRHHALQFCSNPRANCSPD
jgi:isocitrate/isopropylmalate dehydrogenase